MSDYKPGDVAVATVRGVPNVRVFRYRDVFGDVTRWDSAEPIHEVVAHPDDTVTDVRPLVVLDLVDARQSVDVLDLFVGEAGILRAGVLAEIRDQIEAQTKPPKPAEPTGKYAVVFDEDGSEWVRRGRDWCLFSAGPNHHKPGLGTTRRWEGVPAVRVLFEGVTT